MADARTGRELAQAGHRDPALAAGDDQPARRIHFGMIFGPSVRGIYAQSADQLTSYARRFVAEADEIGKDDFIAGLELEGQIYAPLGSLLDEHDALFCPTFAVSALSAEYEVSDRSRSTDSRPPTGWTC